MQTAFVRGLATVLATLTLIGCGPQVKPFPAKTPAESKQLTDVTDAALAVIRNPEDTTAWQQAIAALNAANGQYDQHEEAIRTLENAEVLGCIRAQSMTIGDLEKPIAKRREAVSQQDTELANCRDAILWSLAHDMGTCAANSRVFLIDREQRPEALKHGAVLISEIFSTVEIFRAAAGLNVAPLLKDHIRTYEVIVARVGAGNEPQFVTDALPKLKAALAALGSEPHR